MFICGGQDLLQSWTIEGTKLSSYNISLGKLKRELKVVEKDTVRDCVYYGTTSGDIIKIALNSKSGCKPTMASISVRKPKKGQPSNAGRFSGGVNCILVTGNGDLLVGCGNGQVILVEQAEVKKQVAGFNKSTLFIQTFIILNYDHRSSDIPNTSCRSHIS